MNDFFDETIINKIKQIYLYNEDEIISYVKTINIEKMNYVCKILYKYKDKLNLSNSFLEILSDIMS